MKRVPFTIREFAWLPIAFTAVVMGPSACGSSDEPANPTPNPTPDSGGGAPDTSVTTPDSSVKPDTGPTGGIACGTRTCYPNIVGGQPGAACCTPRMTCGLDFGRGCIDQEDGGGGTPMPPADANPIVPDPSCGQLSIDFMGTPFVLDGCCLADGMCGYYSAQMTSFGCSSLATLGGFGLPIPDAAAKSCSLDGGARPDAGAPGDGGTRSDGTASDTANPDQGSSTDTGNADNGSATEGGAEGGTLPEGSPMDSAAD